MDKNTTTGFILIAIVLIAFSYFNRPSAEEQRAAFVRDSIAQVERMNQEKKLQAEAAAKEAAAKLQAETDTTALFHSAMKGAAQTVVLKNDKVELTLNSKGATVEKAVVKGFKDRNDNPNVTLFQGDEQQLNYTLSAKESNIATQDLFFVPTNVSVTTVTFTATAGEGKTITLDYQLGRDYMLHLQMRVEGMDGLFAPNTQTMDVNWKELCPQQEKGFMFENRYCTLTYKEKDSSTDYLNETSEKRDEQIEEALDWVAFKDQFFSSIMIAKNDFAANSLMTSIPQEKGSGYLKQFEAKMKTFFDPTGKTPSEFEFYYGPNDFRKLQAVETESTFGKDLQMKKLVYLGWPIVRWINRFFTIYVFDFLTGLGLNMGIVLILITLLLKAITYPLVKKSYMSSAKMRVLKPKLDEATKQFNNPEDQMQKQQAMMQEYAKYGVSPLSGCMPMLIQMPIWVAMFNFVPNAIQLRGEKFLWINDLSTYDPIVEWKNSIWGIGDHLSLTCILFCVSNILYSYMTMRQQKDQMVGAQAEQMKMMQWMMYLMPLMFFFMFNDYSSGLNFYYFVSLFFSAAIMFVLRKTTNDAKLLAKLEAKYEENKKNPQKKLGGLAGRLQTMQEEQQRLQKQREELANRRKNLGK
ncbi:MAG: membrane protein insertase YidC [Prevotella sp.]|nr:membrane protein insertase YidC [Prevotella sp.]